MTEEEIKLKLEEQEKKDKKKSLFKKIFIIVGSILFLGLLILIGNVDYFVKISEKNKYDKENNRYLSSIKQDTYLDGYLKLNKEDVIRYFMYTFNSTDGGRDYLVVFWNMTDTKYEIKYKDLSSKLGSNDTSAMVVTKAYSENQGTYLNFKDFEVTELSSDIESIANEETSNAEKTCISNLPLNKVVAVLDENNYVKNAFVIENTEYCQDTQIGSYIIFKK